MSKFTSLDERLHDYVVAVGVRENPILARLRAETTMTAGWIAERLGMRTRRSLNHLLYRRRKSRRE